MTWILFGEAQNASWVPTSAYRDTGERSGFASSILAQDDDGEDAADEACAGVDEVLPLEGVIASATTLGEMQGFMIPAVPLTTMAERTKFDSDFSKYIDCGGRQNSLNFDRFALEWNQSVELMEESKGAVPPIFRKTATHLKTYWAT